MSHAMGKVIFQDGLKLYFEYNGTCDIVINHLYKTKEEVNNNWRNHSSLKCTCKKDEPVEIETNYGGGIYWSGKACKKCKAFTKGFTPYEYQERFEPIWGFIK